MPISQKEVTTMMPLAARVTRIKESPSAAATQRVRDLRAEGVEVLSLTVG